MSELEVTVTIKFGKDYDAPWIVFRGSPASAHDEIVSTFGFDAKESEGLTLAQLTLNATKAAKAANGVSSAGGTAVSPWGARRASGRGHTQEKSEPKGNPLAQLIEGCTTLTEIQAVWGDYSSALQSDEELLALFKAKGKEITEKEGK